MRVIGWRRGKFGLLLITFQLPFFGRKANFWNKTDRKLVFSSCGKDNAHETAALSIFLARLAGK
jgi:hypothetical protein